MPEPTWESFATIGAANDHAKTAHTDSPPRRPRPLIPAPPVAPSPRPRSDTSWPRRYARRLVLSDSAIVIAVTLTFGVVQTVIGADLILWPGGPAVSYLVVTAVFAISWLFCLEIFGTRDEKHVGNGVAEYGRILTASVICFAVFIAAAFFLRAELSRLVFFTVLPLGVLLLVFSRWLWRQWLRAQQRTNRYLHRAILLGDAGKAAHIARTIARSRGTGYALIGVVTAPGSSEREIEGLPVLGDFTQIISIIDDEPIDTIILVESDELDARSTRALGWQLADRDIQLAVAPSLTDIAGPRVHALPVAGLPLVHVAFPSLEGSRRVAKRTFDIIGSGLLILLFSPVLIGAALAVKLSSKGPIIYRQERVGRRGRPFGMLKFRSMIQNADDQLASLLDAQGTSDRPLFKVTDDPRITPVGRFLRKYSIDEFPQLFNVLRGQMSLVGPRPQRPAEVALYDDAAHRRLLVKPGMSGLWQVNGRSALSWEDALRFDLYYVENWSFTQDIMILVRTVRAVANPQDTAH